MRATGTQMLWMRNTFNKPVTEAVAAKDICCFDQVVSGESLRTRRIAWPISTNLPTATAAQR